MSLPLVAIAESSTLPVNHRALQRVLGDSCILASVDLPFWSEHRPLSEADSEILRRSAAIIVRAGDMDGSLIEELQETRIITLHGAGVDQVDVAAATARGIWVTNAPGCNNQAVAELTIGLMIDCLRQVSRAATQVQRGDWESGRSVGAEISGKTVGLIGWGHCASRVGEICRVLGASILVTRKSPVALGVSWAEPVPLEELLSQADIISIHIPLSPDTKDFIGQAEVEQMKPGAVLINTSRGGVLNLSALQWGLDHGIVAAAGLDVLPQEPPSPTTLEMLRRENVIITPHIGGSTVESLERIATAMAEDIRLVLSGHPPINGVNDLR